MNNSGQINVMFVFSSFLTPKSCMLYDAAQKYLSNESTQLLTAINGRKRSKIMQWMLRHWFSILKTISLDSL